MKKLTFILLIIIIITSCNDEMIQFEALQQDSFDTRAAGDGKYDILGYGYNCFYSDFRDPKYSKAKVIDLDMLTSGIGRNQLTGDKMTFVPTEIIEAILHGQAETRLAYGESIDKLAQDIKVNTKAKLGDTLLKLFSLDLKATVNSSDSSTIQNAFYRIESLRITRKLTLPYTNPSRLRYFVTNEFLSDIEYLSGEEIITKYGTHVATDILLGGNFTGLYTGYLYNNTSTLQTEFKAKSSFLLSSVKAGVNYDTNSFKSFSNVNIYMKTQGGTKPITINIAQTTNGLLDNVSLNYDDWLNSVNRESESLIGVGSPDTEIFLISEFIDNPIKKQQVEFALMEKSVNEIPARILSYNSKLSPNTSYALGMSNNKLQFYPPIAQFIPAYSFYLEIEENYYKLKISNKYLDHTGSFTASKAGSSQKWYIHFLTDTTFMLQNVQTGEYLSSYDLSLHVNYLDINKSDFIWNFFPGSFQ